MAVKELTPREREDVLWDALAPFGGGDDAGPWVLALLEVAILILAQAPPAQRAVMFTYAQELLDAAATIANPELTGVH